jgi:LacI family transcriptional regulator
MADVIAIGVIEAARDCGLSVPRDLSVTGFDDMEFADMLQPALTTVRQPIAELGQLAVRRLVDLMGGGQPPRVTRLPVELIARASVAAPREGGT